jgi:hypothetical protein
MSALPPKADIETQSRDVRFVPKADILRCGKERRYSITSTARPDSGKGTVMPNIFTVFRLMISSTFVPSAIVQCKVQVENTCEKSCCHNLSGRQRYSIAKCQTS